MAIKILPEGTIEGSGGMDIGPSRASDIEQTVIGADGRTYGVGSTEMLTDEQKAEIGQTLGGEMGEENIPPSENMGMDSMMPQMSEEEKEIFRYLTQVEGLAPDVAIDIMASEKVKEMGGRVSPEEFGGLPSANPPAVSGSPNAQQPMTPSGAGMSEQDMMNYIVNQAQAIRARTGGQPMGQPMGALPR
jgi:hypothetical protein